MRTHIQITTDNSDTFADISKRLDLPDYMLVGGVTEDGEPLLILDLCDADPLDGLEDVDEMPVEPEARPTVPMPPAATEESPAPPVAAGPAGGAATSPVAPPANPSTCGGAIVEFLSADPDVVFSTVQIAEHLAGRYKESTVKFTLSELARSSDIRRHRPGWFSARTPWVAS